MTSDARYDAVGGAVITAQSLLAISLARVSRSAFLNGRIISAAALPVAAVPLRVSL
jgi:hypothetical protein